MKQQRNLLARHWEPPRLSGKATNTGSGKRQELGRLSGHIYSQGYVPETVCLDSGHSLCPPPHSATAGSWTPYFSQSSEFNTSQLMKCTIWLEYLISDHAFHHLLELRKASLHLASSPPQIYTGANFQYGKKLPILHSKRHSLTADGLTKLGSS